MCIPAGCDHLKNWRGIGIHKACDMAAGDRDVLDALISKGADDDISNDHHFDDPDVHEPLDDERIPHKNWLSVIGDLKNLGYQESQHYKICCSNDHVKRLEYATPCPECERNWCTYLDHFVLGIQLENIFLDRVTIEHLTQGFKGKPDGINCKETWHDQTETLLPTTCANCVSVLKRLLILEAL
ncbi:Rad2 nuclease [Porites harrisoni]